jgi:hypothetical protein
MARHVSETFSTATTLNRGQSTAPDGSTLNTAIMGQTAVIAAVIGGLGLGTLLMLMLAGPAPERLQQDAELAGLVRSMVAIKGLILAGATALVAWRLGRPVSPSRLLGYAGALAMSGAALAWMWSLNAIPVTAMLFYGGLVSCYLIAARDGQLFSSRTRG